MNTKYAVEMIDIIKIFNNNFYANDKINLKVKKGSIHALVGENGAGKSTLMSILFGIYKPNSGEIKINGKSVYIDNPIKANELGIGMVHQHFKLLDNYTVWKNIILGKSKTWGKTVIKTFENKKNILNIVKKYELPININAKIKNLTTGERQKVEIIKTLYRENDILVFDEPTSILNDKEIEKFLDIILKLKKEGKTIIFITHKFHEIFKVCDEATIIRHGKFIKHFNIKDTNKEEIIKAMVGHEISEIKNTYQKIDYTKPILELENIVISKKSNKKIIGLKDFNLKLYPGEILAIAGMQDNGQIEIADVISGVRKPIAGSIKYLDFYINNKDINFRYKLGMSYIPEDRHKEAIFLDENLIHNNLLQVIDKAPFSFKHIINNKKAESYTKDIINNYDIRGTTFGNNAIRHLSGGNQQKAVVGRELSRKHNFILAAQPTRGVDIKAVNFISEKFIENKKQNNSILLLSYDLNEIMRLSDRIIVINEGHKVKELITKDTNKSEIGYYMSLQAKKGY